MRVGRLPLEVPVDHPWDMPRAAFTRLYGTRSNWADQLREDDRLRAGRPGGGDAIQLLLQDDSDQRQDYERPAALGGAPTTGEGGEDSEKWAEGGGISQLLLQ